MAENQRRARLIYRVQIRPGLPVDGVQLERSDPADAASSTRSLRRGQRQAFAEIEDRLPDSRLVEQQLGPSTP
jgi:hypothetical protein